MDDSKNNFVMIFHDLEENHGKIHCTFMILGYKRSFVHDSESFYLPENMFIRRAEDENPEKIQMKEMQSIIEFLDKKPTEHGKLEVFVGDSWISVVSFER
jgi:hypothetical protein